MKTRNNGILSLEAIPRVIGTVGNRNALESLASGSPSSCDIVEVRLDQVGAEWDSWGRCCERIETGGTPVLLTLRLSSQGGDWDKSDKDREPIYEVALEKVSAVDIEVCSEIKEDLCKLSEEKGKLTVVSYHNFQETPSFSELSKVVEQVRALPNAVPKISTMVKSEEDVETLERLLAENRRQHICVMGMGALGSKTRVVFPALGSCFTYGYLDESAAPGQFPSSVLVEHLRQFLASYNEDVINRKQLLECV